MKTKTIKTLLVAAITMAAMSVPTTANAQLGGLVKKAKEKAKEKVEQVVDKKKNEAVEKGKQTVKDAKDEAKMKALETQRPPLPWVMAEDGTYNGIGLEEFVDRMAEMDITEDGLRELKNQMDARFKHNHILE